VHSVGWFGKQGLGDRQNYQDHCRYMLYWRISTSKKPVVSLTPNILSGIQHSPVSM
jgi:uncharacterized protein YjiK